MWDTIDRSLFAATFRESLVAVLPHDPPRFPERVPYGYTDEDRIRADLNAGGLLPDAVERVVLTGRAASARAVAEGFGLGTPVRAELETRGDLEVLTRALADEMTARLGPGPVEGPLGALVVPARRG